jgi:hypothetical protein
MSSAFNPSSLGNQYVNLLRTDKTSIAVTANTNIFSPDFAIASQSPTPAFVVAYVIYIVPQGAGTFKARRTVSGVATNIDEVFNGGTNLSANGAYGFAMLVGQNDTINFQYSISTTLTKFILVEVP